MSGGLSWAEDAGDGAVFGVEFLEEVGFEVGAIDPNDEVFALRNLKSDEAVDVVPCRPAMMLVKSRHQTCLLPASHLKGQRTQVTLFGFA